MKNLQLENLSIIELNQQELILIEGGTNMWYDIAYGIGAFLGGCYYMGQCAQGNPHI